MPGNNIRQQNNSEDSQCNKLQTSSIPLKSEKIQVVVETIVGTQIKVFVFNTDPVLLVKNRLYLCSDIPILRQRLVYGNQELEDFRPLYDYSITDGCIVKLILHMRGGPITSNRRAILLNEVKNLFTDGGDVLDYNKLVEKANEQRAKYQLPKIRMTDSIFKDILDKPIIPPSDGTDCCMIYSEYDIVREQQRRYFVKMKENNVTKMKMKKLKKKLENDSSDEVSANDDDEVDDVITDMNEMIITPTYFIPPRTFVKKTDSVAGKLVPNNLRSEDLLSYDNFLFFEALPEILPSKPINSFSVSQPHLMKEIMTNRFSNSVSDCFSNNRNTVYSESIPRINYATSNLESSSFKATRMLTSERFHALVEQDTTFSKDMKLINDAYKKKMQRASEKLSFEKNWNVEDDFDYFDERFFQRMGTAPFVYKPSDGLNEITVCKQFNKPINTKSNSKSSDVVLPPAEKLSSPVSTTTTKTVVNVLKYANKESYIDQMNTLHSIRPMDDQMNTLHPIRSMGDQMNTLHPIRPMGDQMNTLHPIRPMGTNITKTIVPDENERSCSNADAAQEKYGTQKQRCSECNRKLRISATYTCYCKLVFCPSHRYSETHNCSYDYKVEGRKVIQKNNPLIVAGKLPKI